jgi:NRPS condensation-like uncharacterized protein
MTTHVGGHRTTRASSTPSRSPFTVVDELNCHFDSPGEPNNVHMEAWLPGHLDGGRLRAAVTAMLAGQPKARGRRAAGGWSRRGYAWEFPDGAELDPVTVTNCRDDAELGLARSRFLATAPPLDHSPLFRLLLAAGPEHDSLVLNAHHAAFDGHSCLLLLRLIAQHYSGEAPSALPDGSPAPHQATRRSLPRPSLGRAVRIAPQRPAPAPGYGFSLLGWPGIPVPPRPADGSRATVNDLLIAALTDTITRWNADRRQKPGRIRITMPVDARPPGHGGDLGNLSRLCTITADGPRTPQAVARQTARAKQQPGPPVGPVLAAAVRTPLPVPVKRRLIRLAVRTAGRLECDTSLLSNLGLVAEPPRFGDLEPARMWFSTSAHMPRGLSVGAITVAGRLQLCFRYRYALLDDAAAGEFTAEFEAALSRLAEQQEAAQ